MTLQLRPGAVTPDIPPPPDGSGIVSVIAPAAANDGVPPPPDGSGVAPAPEAHSDLIPDYEAPPQAASHMTPEQEAQYNTLIRTGSADDVRAFLHSVGASSAGDLDAFVVARDKAKAAGQPVNYDVAYALPQDEGGSAARAFGNGVSQGATLGTSDEIHGFLNGVHALVNGGSYGDTYNRTVDSDRAQLGADERDHGIASLSGNLVGGLVLPAGLEKAGLTASLDAVGLAAGKAALREGSTLSEARTIAARAVTRRIATESGAYGAAYGAGAADGDASQRLLGGAEGSVAGLAGGAALGAVGGRLAERARTAAPVAANEVGAAAQRLGLTTTGKRFGIVGADEQYPLTLPADVGGAATRSATAATMQTPFGAGPIIAAARRLNDKAGDLLDTKVAQLGDAADDAEGLGAAATEGAVKAAKLAKAAGGRMYDRANELAGNAQIDLQGARDTLDQQIARLKAVPGGGAGLEEAQVLRATLDKPFSVQGVRDLRTEMFVPQEFRNTPVEGRTRAFVNAAARDIENGLRAQGKNDAADAFRAADDNWRGLLANLKRNVEPVIGKLDNLKDPEAVAKALNSATKNNGTRLGAFVATLPNEQAGIVKASLLSKFGQDRKGVFSVSRFAQDWDKMSPVAKRAMFGSEAMSALNDLATVGRGSKAAMAFGNHSNTGRAAITERTLGTLLTGGSLAGGLPTFGAAVVGQYGMGKLLASPRFARWLARAPRTSLGQASYIERLGRIAQAEPAIASEVLGLQQRLTQAISGTSVRAAAEADNNADVINGQGGQQQPQQQQVAQ